jgi:hypothetical protein
MQSGVRFRRYSGQARGCELFAGVVLTDSSLTRRQWESVLEDVDPATYGELVATLDERDLVTGDGEQLVDGAIDDGVLVEVGGGAFPVYGLETPENLDAEGSASVHVDANPTPETDETASSDEESPDIDESDFANGPRWSNADFTEPESGLWVTEQVEREQWMGHKPGDKQPFSPWADADAPVECKHHEQPTTCAECGHSAQFKWGYEGNYTDHEEALTWIDHDPRLDGLAFIQREDDPLAFVDGDDVRCPETGEVHPVFEAFLEHLGLTYADISVSGAGVHAVYLGSLPEGVKQAVWEIDDEPWGANDDIPAIEIYDGKHVCIATGEHVPGTPENAGEWDDDALEAILAANDQLPTRASADDYEKFDAADYEASATSSSETTEDIRDIYAALDRLDAQRVADSTIVDEWIEPSHADYRAFVPTWAPSGYDGTANFATSDVWKDSGTRGGKGGPACMAAIDAGLVSDRDCPRRVNGETWWKAVDHLRSLGFDIPEYVSTDTVDAESDPEELKALDVTLDTEVAWRAAGAVSPGEVDEQPDTPTTDDGTAWLCPRCEGEIGVVRAAAIDAGITPDCATTLQDDQYDRAYEHARRGLGAPLPEYVNREMATERWDIVQGALRQLDFWHLDEDAFNSDITGRGDDVDGAAQLTIDPAWRDSDSGESVLVFPSGTVYEAHPGHDGALDALRFVALDAGVIDWNDFTGDEYQLTGDTFREAYDAARDYGAPLPRWQGSDAFHTAVLPPVDDLVDEDVGDDDRLVAAYDAVADLYRDAANSGDASLLRVLPGLGKTGQVFRNATEHPALYTAGRKELMADAVERSQQHGAAAYILPVFAENGLPTSVKDTTEAIVRDEGQHLLRDRWTLVSRVENALPDGEELRHPDEFDGDDEESVDLDRESCPTADGEYGLDWWLAVHAARSRGYRPQQIHENAPALFGTDLPCTCEDGEEDGEATCPYTEAWETATNPDAPIDVLVGHYTHAHVEGARTYAYRENGLTRRSPRVVAVDEFPGEAYQREFGEEFPDLAAWLAGALRDDVDDRQDLLTNADDIWGDETVREWLAPDETADEHARIADVLGAAHAGVDVVETAEWLLEERRDACKALDVDDALETLVDAHPDLAADTIESVTATISGVLTVEENREYGDLTTIEHLDELLDALRDVQLVDGGIETALEAAVDDGTHVDGPLASLVTDAINAYRDRSDTAMNRLDAARTALQGGPDGCEALAMHADDGYAHPLAHALLYGILAPGGGDDVATVRAENFNFGRDEGTRLSSVGYQKMRIVVDRNHHGAVVNHPPALTAGGDDNPVVGLDATGRSTLWELVLGREVTTRDIHESMRERREFLREVYGLQMVQTSPHANSYEGDPTGKNFDDDVELVAEIGREYRDAFSQQPAVLTTKVVEDTLDDRLDEVASETDHYGNLKGSNALAGHRLAALLGCQHYGDHVVERWAALAGEEATRTGHGMALDYNSSVANTVLQHMREDQVMQAALRFGRDAGGALVFAHTAALRDDLPVVADGEVVRTFSKQAQAIAKAAGELARRQSFTARDVLERVGGHDPTPRSVRRVLSELAGFGYLSKTETPNGHANEFAIDEEPGAAEVDLPDLDSRAADSDPGRDPLEVYYTWSVRVEAGDPRPARHRTVGRAQLPAPDAGGGEKTTSAPPG